VTTASAEAELEAVVDALFRGPRERFVAERNVAAQRMKALGLPEAAARLRALAKPSVSAWAVNQLWWGARPEVEALLDAGRRLGEAMRAGAGPAVQGAAGQARRRAIEALGRAACEVLESAGHAASSTTLRRITTTLEALAAHAVLGEGPVIGRLTEDLEPPGFDLVVGWGAAPLAPASPLAAEPLAEGIGHPEAEAAVATAEREHDAAHERRKEAAQALDEATRVADEAVLEAQHTAHEHQQAQARAEAARQRAEEAERAALRARADARRERERVDEAREALAGRTVELDRKSDALARARHRLAGLTRGR
jgi:hypothetical protein